MDASSALPWPNRIEPRCMRSVLVGSQKQQSALACASVRSAPLIRFTLFSMVVFVLRSIGPVLLLHGSRRVCRSEMNMVRERLPSKTTTPYLIRPPPSCDSNLAHGILRESCASRVSKKHGGKSYGRSWSRCSKNYKRNSMLSALRSRRDVC